MKIKKALLRFCSLCIIAFAIPCIVFAETVGIFYDSGIEQMKFAAGDVRTALIANGLSVEMLPLSSLNSSYANKKVVISLASDASVTGLLTTQGGTIPSALNEQAYGIRTTTAQQLSYWVLGGDVSGAMYGGLQIAENIKFNGLTGVYNNQESPQILRRGVKLNLPLDAVAPTYESNSKGTSYQKSIPNVWDITFWEEWFDEMARNRYNFISVWNNHPFTSLIKLNEYPNVAIQNVTGFNGYTKTMTMDEKIAFWRQVMKLAHNRGFEFMFFNWNVWVSNANGQYGLSDGVVSSANIAYTAKCMTKLLETYPDLDGYGVTNGENNSTEDFLWGAFGQPVYDYFKINTNRKFRFIHRWHETTLSAIKNRFSPLFTLPNVTFDMSFKYSKAHLYSTPVPSFFDGKVSELNANNMKVWFTCRNDDFYYNSWGDPVFARAYLKGMYDRNYLAGFYIGSDGYCPTRTFLSKNTPYQNKLEIQRQWYSNMLWGRLAYNPQTSDDVFKKHMNQKFPTVSSDALFTAWSKASCGVQKTNELIHGTFDLDFRWYPETCMSSSGFVNVDAFAVATVGPGSNYCSMSQTASNSCGGKKTSLQLATEIETDAKSALDLVSSMNADANSELGVTINSIKAFAYLSLYYANKIRGGTYKLANKSAEKTNALGQAYCWWMKYTNLMHQMYIGQANQRVPAVLPDWHFQDIAVKNEYLNNGGVGTPSCETTCTVSASANGCSGSSVEITGNNNCGGSVTLTAKPGANCNFINFTDGTNTWTTNPLTVNVTADKLYTANFSGTPQAPVANFTENTTNILTGGTVIFTDNSTNIPSSWSWSFPGGTPATSTAQNPSVTYSLVGIYSVSLTATNAVGSGTTTKTDLINVVATPPGELIPWNETFTFPNGTKSDVAPTSWAATNMSVQNNEMSFNFVGNGELKTGVIDISSGPVVVSLKVRGGTGLDINQDFLKLFMKVDGGAEVEIGYANGPQALATWTANINSGSRLELIVRAKVSSATEYYYFDDLEVTSNTTYTITAIAGSNGTINPVGNVSVGSGANQSFTFTPVNGYMVDVVTVDGTPLSTAVTSYTFNNVTANHNISVTFKALQQYTITATAGTNGLINPAGDVTINSGANQSFTITPVSGYEVDVVTVDGTNLSTAVTSYTFNSVVANHTINATFKESIFIPQDVKVLTGWVLGNTNNKVAGNNRMLTVMVMGESQASFSATGVTYGGQAMTKVTERVQGTTYRTYAAIYTLKEAGVNAATSGTIAVTWSATPSVGSSIYSVLLGNVDQTAPITSANNSLEGTTVSTIPLASGSGDMVIMCGATANNIVQTFNNGFTKQFESNSSWGDGIGGNKMGTGVSETPKFTQSASGRMVLCAMVVKKVSGLSLAPKAAHSIEISSVNDNDISIYPNPVSRILNIEFSSAETNREIKVFNTLGQLVYNSKTVAAIAQIDVQSLKIKGIVLVQVITGNKVSNQRVIVK